MVAPLHTPRIVRHRTIAFFHWAYQNSFGKAFVVGVVAEQVGKG